MFFAGLILGIVLGMAAAWWLVAVMANVQGHIQATADSCVN